MMIMNGEVGAPLKSLGLADFGISTVLTLFIRWVFPLFCGAFSGFCLSKVCGIDTLYLLGYTFLWPNRDDLRFLST